jgi:RNA polymerase sigma factor (sigma-70 family)
MTLDDSPAPGPNSFPPTMWSMVRLAVSEHQPGADDALNQLYQAYEKPILAYILRHGHQPQEAQDLAQGFFLHLLEDDSFTKADAAKVKLRAFLLTKLKSYLVDAYRHDTAQKRGGGQVMAMADLSQEQHHLAEPVDRITPDIAFQRQWLQTLLTLAMQQLQELYEHRREAALFAALSPFIDPRSQPPISDLAAKLARPEGTVKSDVSRLRGRWRDIIRDHIAATLDHPSPGEVDAELKELMGYR